MIDGDSVILEFRQVGAYVKVSAMDPVTLTEVSLVGDPAVGEYALKRTAIRKLNYVLGRQKDKRGGLRRPLGR